MATPKQLTGRYRQVKVTVTKDVIEQAERRDSNHCMIADAIKAAMPHVQRVAVDLATIRFTDPEKGARYIYLTPPGVQGALVNFDQGEHNAEFTFWLRQASQVVESGDRKSADGKRKRASRAQKGVVSSRPGTPRSAPVKMGGTTPPMGALANKGNWTQKAQPKKRAGASKGTETNVTLAAGAARSGRTPSKPRQFGLRQLRA